MSRVSRRWVPFTVAATLVIGALVLGSSSDASAQSESELPEAAPAEAAQRAESPSMARGRYLVHHVAMCVQCHSPRSDAGRLVPEKLLRGASMPVDGPGWAKDWAYDAPDIVNLSRGRPDYVIGVLTTGERPDGTNPKSPMPPFRLTDEDARAVVEYLSSLR